MSEAFWIFVGLLASFAGGALLSAWAIYRYETRHPRRTPLSAEELDLAQQRARDFLP